MKNIINSWKSSFVGVVIVCLVGLYIAKIINTEQFLTITGFLASIRFFLKKDAQ